MNKKIAGITALLAASLIWGTAYIVLKDVLTILPPNYANTVRFGVGGLLFTAVFFKKASKINRLDLKGGIITGMLIGFGNAFQTMGLVSISVAVNAFLGATYVIMIPFIVWAMTKKAPAKRIFICALIVIAGTVLLSSNGDFSGIGFSYGEILTLIAAVFYGFAIISIGSYSDKIDFMVLAIIQAYTAALLSIVIAAILEEPPDIVISGTLAAQFLYISIFATVGAQVLMNFGIKNVSAVQAGIIFPTESVFAMILGVIFLKETVSPSMLFGCLLIVTGVIITELEPKDRRDKIQNV